MIEEKDKMAVNIRKHIITRDYFKVPAEGEKLPRYFGKYELNKKIGEGAAGDVYLAHDKTLSRQVVLKILYRMSRQDIQRFQKEAVFLARMQHPNIVQVYETGEFQDQFYIAMQYIDGQSLDKKRLTINQAISVIKQIAQAAEYAHNLSIIHRDIKPSNIIVDNTFKAYLLDFGIAKQLERDKTGTISLTGSIIGTPSFTSPEQARGEIHNIDARTDIYGLGATLYYLVTHKAPFGGRNAVEIINKVQNEMPLKPRSINKKIPDKVEAIILKAMAKEKSERYQTITKFIQDIELYFSGEPIMAKKESIVTRSIKKIARKKVAILAAFFIIILLSLSFYYITKFAWEIFMSTRTLALQQDALSLINRGVPVLNHALKMCYNGKVDPQQIHSKLDEANRLFTQAIDKHPLALAYYYKSMISRELALYQQAQKELSTAIKLDPDLDIARIEMANVRILDCLYRICISSLNIVMLSTGNNLEDTVEDIIKEEKFIFASDEARQLRIFVFTLKNIINKNFDGAIDYLGQFKDWEDNEDYQVLLAIAYYLKNDTDLSIERLTKATKLKPHYLLASLYRASAHMKKDELAMAVDDLNKAIYLTPFLYDPYVIRAYVYYKQGEFDKAIKDCNKLIELNPEGATGYALRGMSLHKKNYLNAAVNDYNKAIELEPDMRDKLDPFLRQIK